MVYICSYSWLLALVSRDLSQTLKIITVVKSEQIHKMTIICNQNGQKMLSQLETNHVIKEPTANCLNRSRIVKPYYARFSKRLNWILPYESPILGQLLDLISLGKIFLFEPRFEFYDPWDMAKKPSINGYWRNKN